MRAKILIKQVGWWVWVYMFIVGLSGITGCGNKIMKVSEDCDLLIVGKVESYENGYYLYTGSYDEDAITRGLNSNNKQICIHRDVIKYDVGDTIRVKFYRGADAE
jgi:hypothetical protein